MQYRHVIPANRSAPVKTLAPGKMASISGVVTLELPPARSSGRAVRFNLIPRLTDAPCLLNLAVTTDIFDATAVMLGAVLPVETAIVHISIRRRGRGFRHLPGLRFPMMPLVSLFIVHVRILDKMKNSVIQLRCS